MIQCFHGRWYRSQPQSSGLGAEKVERCGYEVILRGAAATFSPSTFPFSGEVIALLAAHDPCYIDSIRGHWAEVISGGIDVGHATTYGAILFNALALAVCFF